MLKQIMITCVIYPCREAAARDRQMIARLQGLERKAVEFVNTSGGQLPLEYGMRAVCMECCGYT